MKFDILLNLVRDEAVFSSGFLQAGRPDKADISRQLSRWTAEGKLIQLRRGLYMLAGDHARRAPHRFTIANRIQQGSYVSLQSALAFHSLIPEHVPVVTSVTTARPRLLETGAGVFQFRHLHTDLFFGYQVTDPGDGSSAFLAFPEKALLDLIHLTPGADDPGFLHELRLQNLETLDMKRLEEFARRSLKKKWLRTTDLVKKMAGKRES
jgi:predicted transcriptional regulator of viral defense system